MRAALMPINVSKFNTLTHWQNVISFFQDDGKVVEDTNSLVAPTTTTSGASDVVRNQDREHLHSSCMSGTKLPSSSLTPNPSGY